MLSKSTGSIFLVLAVSTLAFAQYEGSETSSEPFPWPDGKRAALSLSFDDARLSQPDEGIPLLDRYGVKATFYVQPGPLDQRLEAWKKAVADGQEIGNHSVSHPCTGNFVWSRRNALEGYSLGKMRTQLEEADRLIHEKLGVTPTSFAYPCGQKFVGRGKHVQSYVPLVAELFSSGRGWLDENSNDPWFCDMAQLLAMESDNKDFDRIRPLIEDAVTHGRWLILAGHEIGDSDAQTTYSSTLDALCRYANDPANGIWIAPVGTVANYVVEHRPDAAPAR